MGRFKDLIYDKKHFGNLLVFSKVVVLIETYLKPVSKFIEPGSFRLQRKAVKSYLKKNYPEMLSKYSDSGVVKDRKNSDKAAEDRKIWTMWWQGEDDMPELISMCIEAMRVHGRGHEVVVISKDNYNSYIDIPEIILKRFEEGCFSITHFSDIIRMTLLRDHGGMWMDATIYTAYNMPEEVFWGDYYSLSRMPDRPVNACWRWACFCMGGSTDNILFSYMTEFFERYWTKEKRLIHYFLVDFMVDVGRDTIKGFRKTLRSQKHNNPHYDKMVWLLDKPYDESVYRELTSDTVFFKLSRKKNCPKMTEDGQITLYGKLLENIKTGENV